MPTVKPFTVFTGNAKFLDGGLKLPFINTHGNPTREAVYFPI